MESAPRAGLVDTLDMLNCQFCLRARPLRRFPGLPEKCLGLHHHAAGNEASAFQQIGMPRDIYDRPQTAFVAQFIGEHNRIIARIEDA